MRIHENREIGHSQQAIGRSMISILDYLKENAPSFRHSIIVEFQHKNNIDDTKNNAQVDTSIGNSYTPAT